MALTVFDGGARQAWIRRARPTSAGGGLSTALTCLREVEDYLIQLRVLSKSSRRALEAARESLRLIRNQYEAGLVDYLSVSVVRPRRSTASAAR